MRSNIVPSSLLLLLLFSPFFEFTFFHVHGCRTSNTLLAIIERWYSGTKLWTIPIRHHHLSQSLGWWEIFRYRMFMTHIWIRVNRLPFNTGYNFKMMAMHFVAAFHTNHHFFRCCCCRDCWCHCWIDDKVNSFCIGDVFYFTLCGGGWMCYSAQYTALSFDGKKSYENGCVNTSKSRTWKEKGDQTQSQNKKWDRERAIERERERTNEHSSDVCRTSTMMKIKWLMALNLSR